jgi:lipopolysaccharide transport system ATP-binding protein
MGSKAIKIEGLGKRYQLGQYVAYESLRDSLTNVLAAPFRWGKSRRQKQEKRALWALKDINLEVEEGEVIGIIGRNGAGKSTLLKILTRVTMPTEGHAEVYGKVGSLLEVGTGFHPELTGRENVYLNGAILGMRRKEIDRKFDEIVAFSGVEQFLDTPLKRYSSGMQVRLAFAVAAHLEPDILLTDEVLAVGDYEFQQKCFGKMREEGTQGRTVLIVSHQLNNIANLCSRTILLDKGRVVMDGKTSEVIEHYISTVQQKSGEVVWEQPESAPGDDKVRLQAVRTLNADGKVSNELDVHEEMTLQVSYWNMEQNHVPTVSFVIRGPLDEVVCASTDVPEENTVDEVSHPVSDARGLYVTECRFPARFFNTLTYTIDIALQYKLGQRPDNVIERGVLSFTVYSLKENKLWLQFPGSVHPVLSWRRKYLGKF